MAEYALHACTRDPRFPPVKIEELDELIFELSILTPSEEIADSSQLDPELYGVIVQTKNKRGVLLPGVEGVESVEHQIEIASRKAGIFPHEKISMSRFKALKVKERKKI